MFETTIGPVKEAGSTVYLRPETAQGIFLDFKQVLQFARRKPPFGIAQVGKSFRNEITPGNFIFRTLEFEQMEMEFFVPPDEAEQWYEHWLRGALRLVRAARDRPRAPAPARARRRRALALLVRHQRRRVPVPDRLVRARGDRQPRRLRPHPARAALGREARVRRPAGRRALHPARDRAGRRRRALDARVPLRRLRRGRDRRRAAHRAAAAPGARAGQGRGAAAAAQGRPPRARARGLRGAAPPRQGRVRRGRRDRPALPAPGRDRHAVRGHDRPPVARGPHGHAARPRHARAGARRRSTGSRSCCRAGSPSDSLVDMASTAADQVSYDDLYERWERGNWRASEIDFTRGPAAVGGGVLRPRAPRRAVELRAVLLGRGRGHRQPVAVHRRRPARGAEVLPRHPAGRRGAPRRLLQALHARGRRPRRRDDGGRPGGDPPAADLGLRQDVRAARQATPASCAATARGPSSRRRSRSTTS